MISPTTMHIIDYTHRMITYNVIIIAAYNYNILFNVEMEEAARKD